MIGLGLWLWTRTVSAVSGPPGGSNITDRSAADITDRGGSPITTR